jgi:hypothetical protein
MNILESTQNEDKVNLIMRHTIYNKEETIQKLKEFNNNEIMIIKSYMDINEKETRHDNIKSINQEIYKQIRLQLNKSDNEYKGDNSLNNTN